MINQSQSSTWGMVFPGQGSQSIGMLSDIALEFPSIKEIFNQASSILQYDLWDLVENGPKEKLDQTTFTQPALLTASYALFKILEMHCNPFKVDVLAGHSLGEYSALVAANSLEFEKALVLVAARGFYMQESVAEGLGAMAAIVGLPDEQVKAICEQVLQENEGVLSPANYNSIGQVVIAGHRSLIEKAVQIAKEKGAKLASILPVSVPSHCSLMEPAALRLKADLAALSIKNPTIPVVCNVTAQIYQDNEIPDNLVKQLYSPVRFVETIQLFARLGVKHVIECGPGKVLSGLIKRIDKNMMVHPINDLPSLLKFLERGCYAS